MQKKLKISWKSLILAVMLTCTFCAAAGGTMAWLMSESDPVVNTFTYGDINLDLEETDTNKDGDGDPDTNTYPMVPGDEITKDPLITVKGGSEKAWLFVKLEKTGGDITIGETTYDFDDFLTYEMADGWTLVDGQSDVWYREAESSEEDVEFTVIKDNKVTVKETVTKEMLNALDLLEDGSEKEDKQYPTLTVQAYAVQHAHIDSAADAWALIQNQ